MDSAFEKVSVYDFLGVLLTGILVVIISSCLNLPISYLGQDFENEPIYIVIFLVKSYFIGIILQEISSLFDENIFNFRKNARCEFLNKDYGLVKNDFELKSFKQIANEILQISDTNHVYTPVECEHVFYCCKTYLEIKGNMSIANRYNSFYGMSRSMIMALPTLLVLYWLYAPSNNATSEFWSITFVLLLLTLLFFRRAKRFSEYRVRVILRTYGIVKTSP